MQRDDTNNAPAWVDGDALDLADPDARDPEVHDLGGGTLCDTEMRGHATRDQRHPIKFTERNDAWDFEVVMRRADNCTINGCVLASAFPDGGRHELVLYPKVFSQSRQEQLETLIHEIGHGFGLRHFFALMSEEAWPAEVFGLHNKFSIMNYGQLSSVPSVSPPTTRYQFVASVT